MDCFAEKDIEFYASMNFGKVGEINKDKKFEEYDDHCEFEYYDENDHLPQKQKLQKGVSTHSGQYQEDIEIYSRQGTFEASAIESQKEPILIMGIIQELFDFMKNHLMKQDTINLYKNAFLEVYNILITILVNERQYENVVYDRINHMLELFLDCPFDEQF